MSNRKVKGVLYLCDGKVPDCEKTYCAHNGMGDCRHTTQLEHAMHKDVDVSTFKTIPVGEDELILVEPYDAD